MGTVSLWRNTMKIIHTKDGRTLYKDDQGHWLKKGDAEKRLSSDVREPDKEDQIARAKAEADKLNGVQNTDLYFKKDWAEGTGPNSASFKESLAAGKRWINRGYSWNELVEAASSEYYLNNDEASVLNDKLKMYAIQHGDYKELHDDWKKDFEKRGVSITGKKTKIEKEIAEMDKPKTQEEFDERAAKLQEKYVGMDVKTFAESLNSKNVEEKLGVQATDQQKHALVQLFRSVAEHQRSYDKSRTPKVFNMFKITQSSLFDQSEFLPDKWRKTISIFYDVKGNTGRDVVDFLDSKDTHVFMGPKGGLTAYVDGKEVRVRTLDAAFGNGWIDDHYGKKKGKKSE